MTVNRIDFLELLKECFPFADSKGSNSAVCGFDCFLFKDGFISAFNNYMSISKKLPDDFDIDYMLVNAKDLLKIFNKLKGNEIVLTYENFTLKIKDGSMTAKMQATVLEDRMQTFGIDFCVNELIAEFLDNQWKALPKDFLEAVNFCSIPKNTAQRAGIFVYDNNMFDATNSAVVWWKLSEDMDSFIVPDDCARMLLKVIGIQQYMVSEKWIHFSSENKKMFFSIRQRADYTPPKSGYEKIRDAHLKRGEMLGVFLPKDFNAVLDRAVLFLEKENNTFTVKLDFEEKGILVSAKKTKAEFQEFIEWEGEVAPFEPFTLLANIDCLKFGMRAPLMFTVYGSYPKASEISFTDLSSKMYCFTVTVRKEKE